MLTVIPGKKGAKIKAAIVLATSKVLDDEILEEVSIELALRLDLVYSLELKKLQVL